MLEQRRVDYYTWVACLVKCNVDLVDLVDLVDIVGFDRLRISLRQVGLVDK